MSKYPVFKKKEIVVEMPKKEGISMQTKECEAVILYIGEQCELYKEGETILFDINVGREIRHFGKPLWRIENEIQVICKVEEKKD